MKVYQITTVWDFGYCDIDAHALWEECTAGRQTFATLEAATAAIRQDAADWWEYSDNNEADKDVPLLAWDFQNEHHSATIPGHEPQEWYGIVHVVEVRE